MRAFRGYNLRRRTSKYGAEKAVSDGIVFDSKKEARRYNELKILEKAGEITDLERQVKFTLIPAQRELSKETYKKGPKKGETKPGKVIERECSYMADFVYKNAKDGQVVVEDTKGVRTKEYVLKRKMMLFFHGIIIREI